MELDTSLLTSSSARHPSQSDTQVLQRIVKKLGDSSLHYLVDDGAHTNPAILVTFHYMWRTIRPGGWYIIEDMAGAYSTAAGPFAGCYGEVDAVPSPSLPSRVACGGLPDRSGRSPRDPISGFDMD